MATLPVRVYHWAKIAVDTALLILAYVLAFVIRFEGSVDGFQFDLLLRSLPVALLLKWLALDYLGVPRLAWRCTGWGDIGRIVRAVLVGSALLVILRGLAHSFQLSFWIIPYGVVVIDSTLSAFFLIGIRGLWKHHIEGREQKRHDRSQKKRALVMGTGPISVQIARELRTRPQLGLDILGLISEDAQKVGMMMGGSPVVGSLPNLAELAKRYEVDLVLFPQPDDGRLIREWMNWCNQCGVTARVIAEDGERWDNLNRSHIRQVSVEDLLRRPPVRLAGDAVRTLIQGKIVLVTGAGGSIGSQLCREVCKHNPAHLVLLEQAENNLFNIHRSLIKEFPDIPLSPTVADVCDLGRIEQVFAGFKPDVIFHAAAHKHVPMMEWNVTEAVKNNVLGTQGLADLAHQHGVGYFVMVSTDKAVRPTSVMGVSKRVAELYVQALAQVSKTRFVTVRFGNVLGSAGSVIPIFQEQIAAGGPVTVTHKDMQRYFMTIPEACQLILEAGSLGQGGEIFVLDMGQPVKIIDLATDMIRLSGFEPNVDIEIRVTGIRPGEKLYEELSLDEEQAERTRHPRIFIGKKESHDLDGIRRQIAELAEVLTKNDNGLLRAKFKEIVPEYTYQWASETVVNLGTPGDTPLSVKTVKQRDRVGR